MAERKRTQPARRGDHSPACRLVTGRVNDSYCTDCRRWDRLLASGEPFCACGHVVSRCNGTRRGCRMANPAHKHEPGIRRATGGGGGRIPPDGEPVQAPSPSTSTPIEGYCPGSGALLAGCDPSPAGAAGAVAARIMPAYPTASAAKCPHCGEAIAPGEAATAESTYTHARPYFEWEHEYIDTGRGGGL